MKATKAAMQVLGIPCNEGEQLPLSTSCFLDGRPFKVEIPSVEGPAAFEAVLEAAEKYDVRVDRISQGSGVMMQTDDDIRRMVELGVLNNIEVCLFVGPRAAWDIGVQAVTRSGGVSAASLRGSNQLLFGVEDVRHGCELGLRSVLVADLGLLWVLSQMRLTGDLPSDLVLKTSVSLPAANPASARVLTNLGADTINLPVDLTTGQIAAIRQTVTVPLDIYIEGADDFGAPLRYYELPAIVAVAAPVYLKFTVRNAPSIYPSGGHLHDVVVSTARERVRRASIGMAMLARYSSES